MDCKQSETAMMQRMEKTIKPADARDLAKHILSCQNCRELYLAFDEAVELAESSENLMSPPPYFTESVMMRVRAAKVPYLMWGIIAAFVGAGIFVVFNPHLLAYAVSGVEQYLTPAMQAIMQVDIADSNLSIVALFFVVMLGWLLAILHREDHGAQEVA